MKLKKLKKIIVSSLLSVVILSSFSPMFARKAQAQWVVFDPAVFATTVQGPVKEFGLDTVAFILANAAIERIAASTITWINNGFKGSPAFVTDPASYFGNLGNQVAGQAIYNHPDLKFMCASFSTQVQIALTKSYISPFGDYRCTLTEVVDNFEGFMDDFYEGGWDGFVEISQRSSNNPLGLYNQQQNEINVSVSSAQARKQQELNWGNGFLSSKGCETYGIATKRIVTEGGRFELQPDGTNKYVEATTREVTDPAPCLKESTQTPGKVIEEQLNKTLGSGAGRLEVADEISEIISALLNQLISKALGAVGGGLRSLTSPGSGNSGGTFASELATATAQTTIPMPLSGECPSGYLEIIGGECATNPKLQETIDEVNKTANDARNLGDGIADQSPLEITDDGRVIDCVNDFNSLSLEDQAICESSGRTTPPADTSGFDGTPTKPGEWDGKPISPSDRRLLIDGRIVNCANFDNISSDDQDACDERFPR